MPPLPDVDSASYNEYTADQFGAQTERRIGALGFQAATEARIASLNEQYAPSPPPQPAPEPQAPPMEPALPALSESPETGPYSAPASLSAPTVVPQSGPVGPSASATPASPSPPPAQAGRPDYVAAALNAADRHGIDPALFVSQIQQESGFNPNARSPAGAQGIAQIVPQYHPGVDPSDPLASLDYAAGLMASHLKRFGGDIVKALAAYNAGPGTVEKFGGVPPYQETQKYVDSILGRVANEASTNPAGGYTPGPTEGLMRVGSDLVNQQGTADISQFGDPQLTSDEAYAACGPAAAVRFAQRFGRNPTLREATDLASQVGWTSSQGMAGLGSEKALMDKLGVPTKLVNGPAWDVFAKEAQTGNPVTISTAGHYFTADGFNPDTGAFHVGKSGLDLKGGAEWMTPARMQALMGQVQGGLLADNPQVPAPSIADQDTNPLAWLGRQKDALLSGLGGLLSGAPGRITEGLDPNAPGNQRLAGAPGRITEGLDPNARGNLALNRVAPVLQPATNFATSGGVPGALWRQGLISQAMDPSVTDEELAQHAIMALSAGKSGEGTGPDALARAQQAVDELRARFPQMSEGSIAASGAGKALAALKSAAQVPEPTGPVNPFQLHTEPGPNRTLLSPDEAVDHLEDLNARHAANDGRINQLEAQLHGGDIGRSTGVVRPPGTVGWTDNEVIAFAQQRGLNPYSTQGWGQQAGDAAYVAAHKPSVPSVAKQTPAQARAELAQLRAENEQIANAAEHAIDNGAGPLYRAEGSTTEALPWDYNASGDTAATAPAENAAGTATRGGTSDTGAAPQGPRAASAARAPAPPAEPQLAGPYPDYPAPPPAPVVAPQGEDVALRGLINEAKARGYDTSAIEAQVHPPITADMITEPAAPPSKPPAGVPPAPPREPPAPPPGNSGPMFTPEGEPVPIKAGITPDTVLAAHQRIDRAYPGDWPRQQVAHERLDKMLANGATPDQLTRFLSGEVEGKTVKPMSILRTVRTGSMAGGLTTEGKVVLGPVIQTTMRAPVGVIKDLLTGNPGNIRAGLQGGIAGLAEGAADALQTIRYGTNYRAALTGGAEGGYGFAPGIDVMGKNAVTRGLGTAALGLVRTHGAVGDISAGIGRGAALARGASPQAAGEVGQQWAFRSGQYGTIGQAVSNALEGIKRTNPAMDVVGQVLVPFYRVGYNVLTQGVERSPVGLVGTAIDVARAKLPAAVGPTIRGPYAAGQVNTAVTPVADRLANNMFGVGLATLGFTQAVQGNLTGENPPAGVPKWSVRIPLKASLGPLEGLARRDRDGNLYVPMRAFGPAQEALAQGTILYEAIRDGNGGIPQIASRAAEEYVGHIYDESWLRSIGDVFHMITDVGDLASQSSYVSAQAGRDLSYQVQSQARSLIPQGTLINQLSRFKFPDYQSASSSPTPTASPGAKPTAVPTTTTRRYVPPARATATPRARP